MSKAMRWRIMTLQGVLVIVLATAAGFLYWGSTFVTNQVDDQLVAQQIFFPPASEIKAGGAFDPAVYPQSVRQYAGQQVDNGPKAREFANNYIAIHLKGVYNGMTYSQVSTLQRQSPTDAKLAAAKQTLFMGETLRGMLLNAYGWWQVGQYALYGAAVMALATLVVLASFVFELVAAIRPKQLKVDLQARAPVPA